MFDLGKFFAEIMTLPFSWTALRGKHCRHPIAVMGVVDHLGQSSSQPCLMQCPQMNSEDAKFCFLR